LDTYFRGNSHELEFCQSAGAGGNHLVAVTAAGHPIGDGNGHRGHVRLLEKDLAPLLTAFRELPDSARKPRLPDPKSATPSKRPVPKAPTNGLVVRGYCTYLKTDERGKAQRAKRLYYQQNPDAWAAETQNDMLWLTEAEWRSLIPKIGATGTEIIVPKEIQRRFFSTIGIDYMEGSVNALPLRESTMTVTFEKTGQLRIDGYGKMGKAYTDESKKDPRTRGCELSVSGRIHYDPDKNKITAFKLVGIGEAWGNKMEYTRREIGIPGPRWKYGIACELVTGTAPDDLLPPYNMLHYGGKTKYYGE
jgi:hypothetical protein